MEQVNFCPMQQSVKLALNMPKRIFCPSVKSQKRYPQLPKVVSGDETPRDILFFRLGKSPGPNCNANKNQATLFNKGRDLESVCLI